MVESYKFLFRLGYDPCFCIHEWPMASWAVSLEFTGHMSFDIRSLASKDMVSQIGPLKVYTPFFILLMISSFVLLSFVIYLHSIDHEILLHRLHNVFGFGNTVLSWFQSYLENRTQTVVVHGKHSTPASLRYGVPQGSVLGPILFILYTQPLSNVIQHYPVFHQIYADDTQIYKSCRSSESVDTINSIAQCISNVKTLMFHNKLQMYIIFMLLT